MVIVTMGSLLTGSIYLINPFLLGCLGFSFQFHCEGKCQPQCFLAAGTICLVGFYQFPVFDHCEICFSPLTCQDWGLFLLLLLLPTGSWENSDVLVRKVP